MTGIPDLSLLEEFLSLARKYGVQTLAAGDYSVTFLPEVRINTEASAAPVTPVGTTDTAEPAPLPDNYGRLFQGKRPMFRPVQE